MLSIEQLQNKTESEINKISFDVKPNNLFEPIKYILSIGGKRIRPLMTLMACNLFSDNIEPAIFPALGIEVFHNFTLLHDDLMDQAEKRRNKLTVHKKWNTNTAILSGDAMMIASYRLISQTQEPFLKDILNLFSSTATDICRGQQYDMDFEKQDNVSEDDYIEMIRLKTAVLIACSLKTGAIIGGASEYDAQCLYNTGINIGLAFQLQDDLLDVYGDSITFGKNTGGDILSDKKTFLYIKAIELATEQQKTTMQKYRNLTNDYLPEDKIKTFTNIYNELNIKHITQSMITQYYNKAMSGLEQIKVMNNKLNVLRQFAKDLMIRDF